MRNDIYARTNENGDVIKIFSEAFEQSVPTDILIDGENTDRQGANKYQVWDENGSLNYCIVDGKLTERDKTADLAKVQAEARIAELKRLLAETDYNALKYAEGHISEEDYKQIRFRRQAWRNEINTLRGPNA